MDKAFYFEVLYPLQDEVLQRIARLETALYLTGGTAASRGYLQHRFSDDLDLFTNDDPQFRLWTERVVATLSANPQWKTSVDLREERFLRMTLVSGAVSLKIEMINDVPSHVGCVEEHPTLGRLDSAENIFANKISALVDREEPKDLADVWGFSQKLGLKLDEAIRGAQSKAAGIFPADLARLLCTASRQDWELVRWIDPPEADAFLSDLTRLGEEILFPR